MRKYISIALIITLCISLACGCTSKIDESNPTNNITAPTVPRETQNNQNTDPTIEHTAPSDPDVEKDVLHILNLKPTGQIADIPELKICEWWTTKTKLNDISHIDGGTYSYVKSYVGVSHNSWDEMKNVKISDITKSVGMDCCNVSVMRPDGQYASHSVVSYMFGDEANEMTVGQAFDNGVYKCVLTTALSSDFDNLMTKITGEYENPVESIIETWGMPTEVYYTDFKYHYAFNLIYKVDDNHSIVFTGYEKLEDFDKGYRMNFDTISIYGNNSQAMKDLTAEDEYNIKL